MVEQGTHKPWVSGSIPLAAKFKSMREHFLKTILKFRMIKKGDSVLLAVSGGADSCVLLYLLNEIKKSWKLQLAIAHVNHQLRGKASDADETFVRTLGRKLKIPVFVECINVKQKATDENISVEEAARHIRYGFFERIARQNKIRLIATAHNQDDQAETVLMRIVTGTGLRGLQAIRPKRLLNKFSDLYLIRPLIEFSRSEIRGFARLNHIVFRNDRSNNSIKYLRNKIRLKLLPFIERFFNPQVKKTLARIPQVLDTDLSFLGESAQIRFDQLAIIKKNEVTFPTPSFLKLHSAIQYRLLNLALKKIANSELDFHHWDLFLENISTSAHFRLQLPGNVLISVSKSQLRLYVKEGEIGQFSYLLFEGDSAEIPESDTTISCKLISGKPRRLKKADRTYELFDFDKLVFPLTVRNRKPGDVFQPFGQHKPLKLKKFLINQHIPQQKRDQLPLIVSEGRIIWIVGVAMSELAKVDPKTKRIVSIISDPSNRI